MRQWKVSPLSALLDLYKESQQWVSTHVYSLSEVYFTVSDEGGVSVQIPDYPDDVFLLSDLAHAQLQKASGLTAKMWNSLGAESKVRVVNELLATSSEDRLFRVSVKLGVVQCLQPTSAPAVDFSKVLCALPAKVVLLEPSADLLAVFTAPRLRVFGVLGTFTLNSDERALYGVLVDTTAEGDVNAFPSILTRHRELYLFRHDRPKASLRGEARAELLLEEAMRESTGLYKNRVYDKFGESLSKVYLPAPVQRAFEATMGKTAAKRINKALCGAKTMRDASIAFYSLNDIDIVQKAISFTRGTKKLLDAERVL